MLLRDVSKMEKYSAALVVLTALGAAGWLIDIIISALSGIGNNGIFNSSVGNVSRKYETEITPASYAFMIWNVIFIWNVGWLVYAIAGLFRKNSKGPVFLNPVILGIGFYLSWLGTNVFYVVWLVVWDRELLLISFIILLAMTLCGYSVVMNHAMAMSKQEDELRKESKGDLISNYVLVQNGAAVYFSWTTVATMVNLSIALTYDPMVATNLSSATSTTLSLSILCVVVVGWSVLENTLLFRLVRFLYAWYGVVIWAATAVLVKNYEPYNTNSILTIALLCLTLVCLAVKIVIYLYKTKANTKAGGPSGLPLV